MCNCSFISPLTTDHYSLMAITFVSLFLTIKSVDLCRSRVLLTPSLSILFLSEGWLVLFSSWSGFVFCFLTYCLENCHVRCVIQCKISNTFRLRMLIYSRAFSWGYRRFHILFHFCAIGCVSNLGELMTAVMNPTASALTLACRGSLDVL